MAAKRALHIIDGLGIGGAERVVFELATRLRDEQFTSEVISLSGAPDQATAKALEQAGVPVTMLPKRTKLGRGLLEDLTERLSAEPPAIVHTHLFAADLWGGLAADRAGVPVVLSTEHSVNRNEGWLKHRLKCWTHRKRDAVVAISEAVATYSRNFCPATTDKLRIIPNGIDAERFAKAAVSADKTGRPTSQRVPVLLVVGRLEPEKGQLDLLNALPLISQPVKLQLVGRGSQEAAIRRRIGELQLGDRVELLGARQDVERAYAAADIVIVPSRWEGLGLAALEAMAARRPVIASDVDGLREVVLHEQTGLLVNMGQTAEVAAAISRLLADGTLRDRLTGAAADMVKKTYSIESMIATYRALYTELLARETQPNPTSKP
jgi:glycosyltransferase involved in cell wall biosynthesis